VALQDFYGGAGGKREREREREWNEQKVLLSSIFAGDVDEGEEEEESKSHTNEDAKKDLFLSFLCWLSLFWKRNIEKSKRRRFGRRYGNFRARLLRLPPLFSMRFNQPNHPQGERERESMREREREKGRETLTRLSVGSPCL